MAKVLITGGTGMIGTPLTRLFIDAGHDVSHLSRTVSGSEEIPTYRWDISKKEIDKTALEGIDSIVHLAGAGLVDKPWTDEHKQEVIDSRVASAELLLNTCHKEDLHLKNFISASATGWYPLKISSMMFDESGPRGEGFLADVCEAWEQTADQFQSRADHVAKLRIGLVLAKGQGALKQIALPVKYYLAAGLGSGQQAMSWIHIQDVCRMFLHILKHDLDGVYNAVGPEISNNQEFMQILADVMEKPLLLPNIPEVIIRTLFGAKADLILKGVPLSSRKIQATGFSFDYPTLNSALMNIYYR